VPTRRLIPWFNEIIKQGDTDIFKGLSPKDLKALLNLPSFVSAQLFELFLDNIDDEFLHQNAVLSDDQAIINSMQDLIHEDGLKKTEKTLFESTEEITGKPFNVYVSRVRFEFLEGSYRSTQFLADLIDAGIKNPDLYCNILIQ
jgi:hypothetical protein